MSRRWPHARHPVWGPQGTAREVCHAGHHGLERQQELVLIAEVQRHDGVYQVPHLGLVLALSMGSYKCWAAHWGARGHETSDM
jgi:hypothetical protein